MIIAINLSQYESNKIYFSYPMKNNVVHNGHFMKIYYSAINFTLSGMYIKLNLDVLQNECFSNKNILFFDPNNINNSKIIEVLRYIEDDILRKANITDKNCTDLLYKQLLKGKIKISSNNFSGNALILKISGIWDDENSCGLNFKFLSY